MMIFCPVFTKYIESGLSNRPKVTDDDFRSEDDVLNGNSGFYRLKLFKIIILSLLLLVLLLTYL